MAFPNSVIGFVAVFIILQPVTAAPPMNLALSPLLPPILDDVCNEVECGKGSCKASTNNTFFFECDCDPGWKQPRSDHDHHLNFLPCIVPNCSLDYSCSKAPATSQQKSRGANATIFDPCYWTDCGGGSCNKTSSFTYSCICSEGYDNLLNVTAFPCFRECSIGMDCSNLGISLPNKSTSSPTQDLGDSGSSQGCWVLQGNSRWLVSFVFVAIFLLQ